MKCGREQEAPQQTSYYVKSVMLELMIPSLADWVLQRSAHPYKILGDLGSIPGVATLSSTVTADLLVEWGPLEAVHW